MCSERHGQTFGTCRPLLLRLTARAKDHRLHGAGTALLLLDLLERRWRAEPQAAVIDDREREQQHCAPYQEPVEESCPHCLDRAGSTQSHRIARRRHDAQSSLVRLWRIVTPLRWFPKLRNVPTTKTRLSAERCRLTEFRSTHRLLFAVVTLVVAVHEAHGVTLEYSSASPRPPSSIARDTGSAQVSLALDWQQVTRCTRAKRPVDRCEAVVRNASPAVALSLVPIPDERILSRTDSRKVVSVQLGGSRPPAASVRLGTGLWEVEWTGKDARARMVVRNAEDFSVKARAVIGACRFRNAQCQLVADAADRAIEIPDAHRIESP
jgi:hypothetical protein